MIHINQFKQHNIIPAMKLQVFDVNTILQVVMFHETTQKSILYN